MESLDTRLRTNLRKGILEYSVLSLVLTRDVFGKALAVELLDRDLIASEGSLYPLLARLRDEDLIRPKPDRPVARRRYYAVTPKGMNYIEAFEEVWAELSPRIDAIRNERRRHGRSYE